MSRTKMTFYLAGGAQFGTEVDTDEARAVTDYVSNMWRSGKPEALVVLGQPRARINTSHITMVSEEDIAPELETNR